MNITSILQQTGAIDAIAKQLGVDEQTARTGASILLPAIVAGMGRSSAGSGGLGGLAGAIAGQGGGGLLDLVLGSQPAPVEKGNDILGQIFGNKDVSRSVATEAAGASGMSPDLLKKMLPLLAMAAAGYLATQAAKNRGAAEPLAPAPAPAPSPAPTSTSPEPELGGILGSIIGGLSKRL